MASNDEILDRMGARIVEKRKQLRWSQEQLAEEADITIQMLSTAERGAKGMRPINLMKISDALGVSADYLLKGTTTNVDNDLLLAKISNLTHDQRIALENIIDNYVKVCDEINKK